MHSLTEDVGNSWTILFVADVKEIVKVSKKRGIYRCTKADGILRNAGDLGIFDKSIRSFTGNY